MAQLVLYPHFAQSFHSLWASNLYGGHPANHYSFIEHFKPNSYQLQHFSAAFLYPWVLNCVRKNPATFFYLPEAIRENHELLSPYLQKEHSNLELQEKIITQALEIEAGELACYVSPLFIGTTELEFLPQEGVPYIRDTQFVDTEGRSCFLVDNRSPLLSASGKETTPIVKKEIQLANGTFWVGSNYTLLGLSEFVRCNGFTIPEEIEKEQTEKSFKEVFCNHRDYPIIWVGPEKPIHYRGHYYYYPLTGHLDDFIQPLYRDGKNDIYLYAELDSRFYCGSRKADSDVIENLQRPLLQNTAQHLNAQLQQRGKKLTILNLPVLWDDAGIYSYINCIPQLIGKELVLHLPQFRIEGNKHFNLISTGCENEIADRLMQFSHFTFRPQFISEFNFTENVRANKGGIHCMVNHLFS